MRATLRDPFTATILVAVPLGALLIFGFVLSTSVKHLSLAVLDANATAASRRLVAELAATGTFDPRPVSTRAELQRALVSGRASVAIVIPPDFDRALLRGTEGGRPPEIQVLYDGGEAVLAGNAEGFLRAQLAHTGATLATTDLSRRPVPGQAGVDVVDIGGAEVGDRSDPIEAEIGAASNQAWTGTHQVRFYKLQGDTLTITSAPAKHPIDGKEGRSILVWKRVKGAKPAG